MHSKLNQLSYLYEKYDLIKNKRNKIKNSLMKSLFDTFAISMNIDIFNKNSSFENLDFLTKIICNYVNILSKGEVKKYTEILNLFELLVIRDLKLD